MGHVSHRALWPMAPQPPGRMVPELTIPDTISGTRPFVSLVHTGVDPLVSSRLVTLGLFLNCTNGADDQVQQVLSVCFSPASRVARGCLPTCNGCADTCPVGSLCRTRLFQRRFRENCRH